MKAIYTLKVGMADQSSAAFFSLTQAEYAAGMSLHMLFITYTTSNVIVICR